MPTISRTYAARDFKLILAGVDVGLVKSVEGGAITADVIAESVVNGVRPKHLGPARIEPFTIECDLPLDPAVSGWIAQSWANSANLQDGAIVELDDRFAVHSVRRFQGARVLETTISAVDAAVATKEAGSLTIQFQPQAIEFTKDADVIRGTTLHKPHKSIPWSKRNFRLEIAGLDCTKVSTMDSFTIKQMATELSTDFPHLKITLAEGTAQTWIDWHENLVIAGNSSDERNGALIFLSPNMLTEFGRINFFNLGIFKILPDKEDGRSDKVRQVTAELYCERMEFQLGAANANSIGSDEKRVTSGVVYPRRAGSGGGTPGGARSGEGSVADAASGAGAASGAAYGAEAAGGAASHPGSAAGAASAAGGAAGAAYGGGAAGGAASDPGAAAGAAVAAGGAAGAASVGEAAGGGASDRGAVADPNAVARLGVANTFTSPQTVSTAMGVGAIIGNATGGSTAGVFGTSNSDAGFGGHFQNNSSSGNGKALVAMTKAGTEALTVLASGNVGIGTGVPMYPLDVKGEARVSGTLKVSGATRVDGNLDVMANTRVGDRLDVGGSLKVWANATVMGTLTKSSGSFKIDHPQDPSNKYLYHSFVESPDMMNIYNGTVLLDARGDAWITLPDWFEMLNRDFRYQLTAIGAPGPNLYISSEIEGNRFQICGGEPGMKVSWQVTGVRHDPYAKAHRIPVEEDKPVGERGGYLFPELYGPTLEKEVECAHRTAVRSEGKGEHRLRKAMPVTDT